MFKCSSLSSIRKLFLLTIVIGSSILWSAAQSSQKDMSAPLASAPNTKFEVASVRKTAPNQYIMYGLLTYPGGRVESKGNTLFYLIQKAYNVTETQIVGGPSWIDKQKFDIEATSPDSVAARFVDRGNPRFPPSNEIRQMLQNLLADRFQLKVHIEQRNGKIYELVRSKHPLHLNPPKNKNAFPWAGGIRDGVPSTDGLRGQNISMVELAKRMSDWLHCPVVDRTGISGPYDFEVVRGTEEGETSMDVDTSIFQSIRELGLDLKKSTGPSYKLVVDQASFPSSN